MNTPFDAFDYFASDTLLHSEVPCQTYGFAATETPFRLRHDGWSGLLLLLCTVLAAKLVLRIRKKFRELLRDTFFPIQGKKEEPVADDPLRYSTRLAAVCLLSLSVAVIFFSYSQHDVGYYPFPETPYLLFGAFFLLCLAYFFLKRMMGSFVNWIFFRKEKIITWQRSFTFLLVAEALLFFALSLAVSYLSMSQENILFMTVALVLFAKLILIFKTYQIFFPKIHGILHLFVYFCTLELIPMLVLQQMLTYAECLSVIKL